MLKRTVKIFLCLLLRVSVQLELMLRLAKAIILWNWSVKIHPYMICGVVATSISGCDVCTVCRVVCDCDFDVKKMFNTAHA